MAQPELLWAMLCDYFLTDAAGKYSLIGVFDRIGGSSFPAVQKTLYVVAALSGGAGASVSGLVDIWAPDGSLILSTPESRLVFSPTGRTLFVNLIYDLQLPAAGQYNVTVEAAGRPAGSFSFEVYQAAGLPGMPPLPPPPPPPA